MCLRGSIRHGGGGWGSICFCCFPALGCKPIEQLLSVYFVSDNVLVAVDPGMNMTQLQTTNKQCLTC